MKKLPFANFFAKKNQKNAFSWKSLSKIHKFTNSHKFVSSYFAHNKYIIYNIIILLWRFFQLSPMRESVNL